MTNSAAILASLEIASERGGDLTDAVYARLFAAHPAMADLFVRDTNGSIKGEMLARVFEMVLDYIDRGAYAEGMIRNEVTTHAGYDVPPDVFPIFFEVVAQSLREAAGEAWTPDMTIAWDGLLADFRRFAAHG
ncbi:MAG: globin domain-containing protein [Caulobacteraceae bacterium]